jgi:hypothetical protein
MSASSRTDPKAIRKALDLMGEEVRAHKLLGEIMIHEGDVFLLSYSWSDDGRRIEIDISLDGRNGPLQQAAERAGDSVGLPQGWVRELLPTLCEDEGAGSSGFPVGMYPSWERPGLRVLAAPPQLILPMIFLASLRPEADLNWTKLEPALALAARAGIKTSERLRSLVQPYLKVSGNEEGELDWRVEQRLSHFEGALQRFGYGVILKTEPRSLAEVADLTREDRDCFVLATGEFDKLFYLEGDKAAKQAMIEAVPIPTGDAKVDAWIGAMGEHLAQRWELEVPAWSQEAAFMGGSVPHFCPYSRTARGIQIVETPPAFRRRLLFTWAEPLMNAKFPHDRKVTMPFWG